MNKKEGFSRIISLWNWIVVTLTTVAVVFFLLGVSSEGQVPHDMMWIATGVLVMGFTLAYTPQLIAKKGALDGLALIWAIGFAGFIIFSIGESDALRSLDQMFGLITFGVIGALFPSIVLRAVRWIISGFQANSKD